MPIPPDPLVGAVLGDRYEVLRPISWGGMDDVYEAADRILERRVAVRLYPTATPEDRARFEAESRILTERDVPRVYDTGPHGDETYLVFELADGDLTADRDATVAMPVPVGGDPTGEVTAIVETGGATAVLPAIPGLPPADGTGAVPRRSRELPLWGAVLGVAVVFAAVIVFAVTCSPASAPTPTTVVTSTSITTPHRSTSTTATTEVSTTISTTTSVPDTSSTSLDTTTTTFVAPTTSVIGLGTG